MTRKFAHHFAPKNERPGEQLLCACGHVELIDGDPASPRSGFSAATDRMNAHIRASYTDDEWEELMGRTKLALLDGQTGDLKMPEDGPKS